MRFWLVLVLACICAVACSDSATDPSDLMLTTDSSSYTATAIGSGQVRLVVVATFHNTGLTPVSLERCSPSSRIPMFGLEVVRPSSERSGYNNFSWACVDIGPFVVAPGETRVDTLSLQGPGQYDPTTGKYTGALEGTFRLSYGSHSSNAFTIRLPAGGIVPYVPRDLIPAIQTDSQLVHMRYRLSVYETIAPIRVTIFNPRRDTSYIDNCASVIEVALEKRVNDEWLAAWSSPPRTCTLQPIVIAPFAHYETSVTILGVERSSDFTPRFAVDDVPGVYRLVWTQMYDKRTRTLIPVELRRSNAFAIVVDR